MTLLLNVKGAVYWWRGKVYKQ